MTSAPRRLAAARLLQLAIQANRDGPTDATAQASLLLTQDPDNLVSRLACAVITDLGNQAATPAPDPAARVATIRPIIAGSAPAIAATLHNNEIAAAWLAILEKNISRRDVAVNAVAYFDHVDIRNHFEALPILQRRLATLADDLDSAHRSADADFCRRSAAGMFLGLLRAELDFATRLLCAELLARTVEKSDPDSARAARRLRDDFHARAAEAPPDLTDPSRSPVALPQAYRLALGSLAFSGALALCALGSAGAIAAAPFAALGRLLRRKSAASLLGTASPRRSPRILALLSLLTAPVILAALAAFNVAADGIHAESWLLALMSALLAAGALLTVAQWSTTVPGCERSPAASAGSKSRTAALCRSPLLFAILAAAAVLFLPRQTTALLRSVDALVPTVLLLPCAIAALVVAFVTHSSKPLRAIIRTAALAWCVNMAAALLSLQVHRLLDRAYQHHVVAARMDELAVRLGDNWQADYLAVVLPAYDAPIP